MIATEKKPFTPTAVLITEAAEFKDGDRTAVDPALVTLLHLDSDENSGWLYTREEWEQGREPRIYRRYGEHEGLQEGERVELLPDLWIVKIDETEYWLDPVVLAKAKRIFGVYAFDRRQHTHCCSFTPSYWLEYITTEWEERDELTDAERDDVDMRIHQGEADCESSNYYNVSDVDRMIANACRPGFLPTVKSGGYKLEVVSVVTDDAIEEAREVQRTSSL